MPKPTTRPPQSPVERRLARLVAWARGIDLWERLWRGLIPPLVVAGVFLAVSWLGLWLVVPHWARALGLVLFATVFVASTFGLWRLRPLSRADALRRVDRASGAAHRPAASLDDRLAAAGRDAATDALWALHQRRAETEAAGLTAGRPSPRSVELDRFAIRFGVVAVLFACALVAGPQRYARVAAAFDFADASPAGPGYRIDAWIDPPAYTGKPPVLLDLASDAARDSAHPLRLAAPAGSTVVIRSSGGSPVEVETSGPLLPPAKPKKEEAGKDEPREEEAKPQEVKQDVPPAGDSETKLVLHGNSRLTLRHGGGLRGVFELAAIPDRPPTIMLREVPKHNARGSLTLAYTVGDDYGVASAEARFSAPKIDGTPAAGPALVDPPKVQLSLPGLSHGLGDGETTVDLSESPWAGASATMVLVARDEGGNEGRSEPVEIVLPEKPFTNPLARALVEQRRNLVLNPGERNQVAMALDAMMIEPDAFGVSSGVYLGLRFAADTLAQAQTNPQLVAVADYLWGMALQIENGDLTEAEKALRNAEKALRDAIDRRAPPEEIAKLTEQLQAAMDKFLKELAEQDKKSDQQQAQSAGKQKSISKNDLQKLIDRLKDQAKSGNREEAKKALDELQDLLENLKTAKRQKADPQARAHGRGAEPARPDDARPAGLARRDLQEGREGGAAIPARGRGGRRAAARHGRAGDASRQAGALAGAGAGKAAGSARTGAGPRSRAGAGARRPGQEPRAAPEGAARPPR